MTTLSDLNSHPKDSLIKFNSRRHTYSTAKSAYLRSVTKIVSEQFGLFDADKIISKMTNSVKWPTSKYYGMSPKEIKQMWNNNGQTARVAGTKIHDQIEKYCNGEEIEADEGDVALEQFLKWDLLRNWNPYRTEWKIFDDDLKIAGTVDAVFEKDGEYVLVDWKRSKEIVRGNKFDCCVHPELKHLPECNFVKYSLQLNLYKYILEKNYGLKISKVIILNIHPDQESFDEIEALDLEKEVSIILGVEDSSNQSRRLLLSASGARSGGIKISGMLYLE
mgnify:CR=1 FL=1